jgi:hypothetical protein
VQGRSIIRIAEFQVFGFHTPPISGDSNAYATCIGMLRKSAKKK